MGEGQDIPAPTKTGGFSIPRTAIFQGRVTFFLSCVLLYKETKVRDRTGQDRDHYSYGSVFYPTLPTFSNFFIRVSLRNITAPHEKARCLTMYYYRPKRENIFLPLTVESGAIRSGVAEYLIRSCYSISRVLPS